MNIKFWGVRGSIPSPLSADEIREKIKKSILLSRNVDTSTDDKLDHFLGQLPPSLYGTYGGNTPCISIELSTGPILVLDIGSGARNLGYYLMEKYPGTKNIHILMSHTHWDHIQGLPFFLPVYDENSTLIFYSPKKDLEERLIFQQQPMYFPKAFHDLPCIKIVKTIPEKSKIEVDSNLSFYAYKLIHPGDSYAFKIVHKDKFIIYATDTEFYQINEAFIDKTVELWGEPEVLIFDAQYTPEEYIKKVHYGHSTSIVAVDIAVKCKTKKLILFHHEPMYTDDFIDNTVRKAKEYLDVVEPGNTMEIIGAYEGLEITV